MCLFWLYCLEGFIVNEKVIEIKVNDFLMFVIVLNLYIGYEKVVKIVKLVFDENMILKEVVIKIGFVIEK